MKITQRTFSDETDQQQMLLLSHRLAADNLHVIDLPYRFSRGRVTIRKTSACGSTTHSNSSGGP